jgi:hypothetical protein
MEGRYTNILWYCTFFPPYLQIVDLLSMQQPLHPHLHIIAASASILALCDRQVLVTGHIDDRSDEPRTIVAHRGHGLCEFSD